MVFLLPYLIDGGEWHELDLEKILGRIEETPLNIESEIVDDIAVELTAIMKECHLTYTLSD